MSNIYNSAQELVGKTPLLRLSNIEKLYGLSCRVLAKIEGFNVGGSIKDRAAMRMLDEAEKSGKIAEGSTIIEPTSGNTGIGLSWLGAVRGYKVIIVMPDSMSKERQMLMTAYGAKLVLTPGKLGMKGAIAKAEELANEIPQSFIAGQFINEANPKAHFETTGPEIYADTDGDVDILVAGVGTGGTITGTGRFLKSKKSDVRIVAVEPEGSAVLSGEAAGSHRLQGIGAGFIPDIYDSGVVDEVLKISDSAAMEMGKVLARKEGILAGISSAAALCGAVMAAKTEKDKTIVVILPDTGDRYLSTELFVD